VDDNQDDPAGGGPWLMVLTEHDRDGVHVRLWGDLDVNRAPELERELARIAADLTPQARVVVDATALTFIDSAAIRVLDAGRRAVLEAGGRFRLVAGEALRRLIELSGLRALLVDG
jgi:anti-sigma B factor antagonist